MVGPQLPLLSPVYSPVPLPKAMGWYRWPHELHAFGFLNQHCKSNLYRLSNKIYHTIQQGAIEVFKKPSRLIFNQCWLKLSNETAL